MQQKSKINWWAILAVVIIGTPVGFILMKMFGPNSGSEQSPESDTVSPPDTTITKPEPPRPLYDVLTTQEALDIISSAEDDKRIPQNCLVIVNETETLEYRQFRKKANTEYSNIQIESLECDKDNVATRINIKANVKPVPIDNPEPEPITIEQLDAIEAQEIVAAGKSDKRISKACQVTINGEETKRYIAFCSSIKKKEYTDVIVTDLSYDKNNYVTRINVKATKTPPPPPPLPKKLTVGQVQAIVAAGKQNEKIPGNCIVKANGLIKTYKEFSKEVRNKSYKRVEVTSLDYDETNILRSITVNADVAAQDIPAKLTKDQVQKLITSGRTDNQMPETCMIALNNGQTQSYKLFIATKSQYKKLEVTDVEYDESTNKVKLVKIKASSSDIVITPSDIQPIVASGSKNSKIPEGCAIVVNGHETDYQSFRMGVNYKAYSNVRVTDVKVDAKGVITRINVTATERREDN